MLTCVHSPLCRHHYPSSITIASYVADFISSNRLQESSCLQPAQQAQLPPSTSVSPPTPTPIPPVNHCTNRNDLGLLPDGRTVCNGGGETAFHGTCSGGVRTSTSIASLDIPRGLWCMAEGFIFISDLSLWKQPNYAVTVEDSNQFFSFGCFTLESQSKLACSTLYINILCACKCIYT